MHCIVFIVNVHFAMQVSNNYGKMFWSWGKNKNTKPECRYEQNAFAPSPSESKSLWSFDFFREARSERLPEILVSSIYVFVFLSGLWEQMTNDTEGSTSRSLKLRERYDLSLWLTCAISLRTYSNSWLNPSLFRCHFFISVPLHSPCFDLYSGIKICCLYKGSHLDGTPVVWERNRYESLMTMCSIKSSVRCELGKGLCTKMHQHAHCFHCAAMSWNPNPTQTLN